MFLSSSPWMCTARWAVFRNAGRADSEGNSELVKCLRLHITPTLSTQLPWLEIVSTPPSAFGGRWILPFFSQLTLSRITCGKLFALFVYFDVVNIHCYCDVLHVYSSDYRMIDWRVGARDAH